jgi:transposase-like protein
MDPKSVFCPEPGCPFGGEVGQGNITIQSQKENRYRCKACRKTFSARKGTIFYRKKTPVEVLTVVLTLLAYGCPIQAVVVAFGLDERTVTAWLLQAGSHCQVLHEREVQSGRVELEHVQADEMWIKRVGGKLWLAMALCPGAGPSLRSPRPPGCGWEAFCRRSGTSSWLVPSSISSVRVERSSRCSFAPTDGSLTRKRSSRGSVSPFARGSGDGLGWRWKRDS